MPAQPNYTEKIAQLEKTSAVQEEQIETVNKAIDDHEVRIRKAEAAAAKGAVLIGIVAAVGAGLFSWALSFIH